MGRFVAKPVILLGVCKPLCRGCPNSWRRTTGVERCHSVFSSG